MKLRELPLFHVLFLRFHRRNSGKELHIFFSSLLPGANYHEHFESAVLARQLTDKARDLPFPTSTLPCPETIYEYWTCSSRCLTLPVMEEAMKFSRYCRAASTF